MRACRISSSSDGSFKSNTLVSLLEINTWAAPHRISQIASESLSMQAPDLSLSQVISE